MRTATRLFVLPMLPVVLTGLNACTAANWYQGVREAGRQQCRQNPDQAAQRACLEKFDATAGNDRPNSYEAYENERQTTVGGR